QASLGSASLTEGDLETGRSYCEQALALASDLGSRDLLAGLNGCLGLLHYGQGDLSQARAAFAESIAAAQNVYKYALLDALGGLGWLAQRGGDSQRAARLFGAVDALYEVGGGRPFISLSAPRAEHDRSIEAARATLGEEAFAAAWAEG